MKTPTPIRGKAVTEGHISSGRSTANRRARRRRMLLSTLEGRKEGEKKGPLVGGKVTRFAR